MTNSTRWSIACLVLGLGSLPAWGAQPAPVELEQWLQQLDDEQYAQREAATRQLQAAGAPAIEVLARGVLSQSPEAAWRAGEALKQLAIHGDEQLLDQVAAAFDKLGQGKPGLTGVVAEIRARQRQMKHDRAASQVRALGGQLSGGAMGEEGLVFGGGFGGFGGAAVFIDLEEPLEEIPAEAVPVFEVPIGDAVEKALKRLEAEPLPKPAVVELREAVDEVLPLRKIDSPPLTPDRPELDVPPLAPADPDGPPAAPAVVPVAPAVVPVPPAVVPVAPVARAVVPVAPVAVPAAPAPEPVPAGKPAEVPAAEVPADIIVGEGDIDLPLAIVDFVVGEAIAEPGLAPNETLLLDANWKGGDAGLKVLADLPDITNVSISNAKLTDAALGQLARLPKLQHLTVQKTRLSSAALQEFRKRKPNTRLFAQGEAMLGIHADTTGRPCILTSVYPSSGAAEAGLIDGDRILAVDGAAIADFADLTIAVYPHVAGDKLQVEFERGGERKKVEVVLKARATLERRE